MLILGMGYILIPGVGGMLIIGIWYIVIMEVWNILILGMGYMLIPRSRGYADPRDWDNSRFLLEIMKYISVWTWGICWGIL